MTGNLKTGWLTAVFCTLLIGLCPLLAQSQKADDSQKGKIKEFEEALSEEGEREQQESETSPFFLFLDFGDEFLLQTALGPVTESDSTPFLGWLWENQFSLYPYASGSIGMFSSGGGKNYFVSFSADYFYGNSRLSGIGLRARAAPLPFVGAEFRFLEISEIAEKGFDHIRFYDLFVNYYRVRHTRWSAWWGVGFKAIEGNRLQWGPGLNLAAEVFFPKPFSLFLNYSAYSINRRSVSDFIFQGNVFIRRVKFFAGYRATSVGNASLEGMFLGTGVFF